MKTRWTVHYSLDTILVRTIGGSVKVKAKDEDKAREKAVIKLAKQYADITDIRLKEIEREEKTDLDQEHERRTAILNELAAAGVEITNDLYDWVVQRGEYAPDEFVPDCRCGASSRHGIEHARWCENREED